MHYSFQLTQPAGTAFPWTALSNSTGPWTKRTHKSTLKFADVAVPVQGKYNIPVYCGYTRNHMTSFQSPPTCVCIMHGEVVRG